MIIHLDTLKDGSHRQSWSGDIAGIDLLYPEQSATVQVRANIHRLSDLVTVRGHIRSRLVRPCDRCLSDAVLALEAPLNVVVRVRSVALPPEEGDEGEYIITVTEEQAKIDLHDQIRDRMIVEVPMAVHCREDCKGLCPQCGADLNTTDCGHVQTTDDRWAALRVINREKDE